jgi:alkyl hydroperoxide reductase subunit AhpC
LVKLYKKYHPKGLNMLSVSLDKKSQRNRWLNAIKIDNMNWQHVSNLQFWRGPIVKKYNVKSIPKTFILDAEGKIVATGLRGSALDRKLKELFGE